MRLKRGASRGVIGRHLDGSRIRGYFVLLKSFSELSEAVQGSVRWMSLRFITRGGVLDHTYIKTQRQSFFPHQKPRQDCCLSSCMFLASFDHMRTRPLRFCCSNTLSALLLLRQGYCTDNIVIKKVNYLLPGEYTESLRTLVTNEA